MFGEIFVAGSGHETNEFYESELSALNEATVIPKEKVLTLLSYLQASTTRVLMEINSNHKPVFEGLFKQSLEFVNFVASMPKIHDKAADKLTRSDPNAMFNRVTRRTFTADGLRNVESFLACSDKFHDESNLGIFNSGWSVDDELRDNIKQVSEDAGQQYNQSAMLIRSNIEKNQAYLKRQQDQLEALISELRVNQSLDPSDWPKLLRIMQQAHQSILDSILLLIQESPKVIRGSFELVEYAIESVCTVLRKIKALADEKGYNATEASPLQQEIDLKLLRIPDEGAEIIFQKHLSQSFAASRTTRVVATVEGDKIQRMVNLLLGDWYTHCAPILTPIGSKIVKTDVQGIPSTIVNMLPTFQSSHLLAQIKVLHARLSVKSIPTAVDIALCPDMMVVSGSALNAVVLLQVPISLIAATKHINNFLGSRNGLAVLTAKGEMSLYFKSPEERDEIAAWVQFVSSKADTPRYQAVLNWLRLLILKLIENIRIQVLNQYCMVVSLEGQAGELDLRTELTPLLKAQELRCKRTLYWIGQPGVKTFSNKIVFKFCSIYKLLRLMAGMLQNKVALPGANIKLIY